MYYRKNARFSWWGYVKWEYFPNGWSNFDNFFTKQLLFNALKTLSQEVSSIRKAVTDCYRLKLLLPRKHAKFSWWGYKKRVYFPNGWNNLDNFCTITLRFNALKTLSQEVNSIRKFVTDFCRLKFALPWKECRIRNLNYFLGGLRPPLDGSCWSRWKARSQL